MTAYTAEQAARDLEWLQAVGAVRAFEQAPAGAGFLITTADRREHALSVDEVRGLRLGVLTGWRLPRAEGVIG